uniref:Uncharacterized protein n=2 Tax=Chrysotila carterae TaxID=13221 RepID=A0A7S4B574_CHRCT|mmetsp:Transcript_10610/g.22552  ORF Transcript_10610/g.22552 Transcript_10610/m.22552 type:complete len:229 (+) Transcript_10610:35-721(+)
MEPEKELKWCSTKLGNGISLDAEAKTVSRFASSGWGVQLTDIFLNSRGDDTATAVIVCEKLGSEAFFGVVGNNFYPGDWDIALSESLHATVINASEGRSFHHQSPGLMQLRPLKAGSRIKIEVDMQLREMRIELLEKSPSTNDIGTFSISMEHLPPEVTLAVGFGTGENRVRIESSSVSRSGKHPSNKLHPDLWDEDNKVQPLALQDTIKESEQAKMARQEAKVAAFL